MPHRSFLVATLVALAFVVGISVPASAHSVKAGSLSLTDLWARATPPNAPTAGGYLTIENTGQETDRLIAASSPSAGKAELHAMSIDNGTMIMRSVGDGIEIPVGGTVTLAPGGLHIMFMDLTKGFAEGEKVPVMLTFEKAGTVETFLHVLPIGSPGPAANADQGDHDHGAVQ